MTVPWEESPKLQHGPVENRLAPAFTVHDWTKLCAVVDGAGRAQTLAAVGALGICIVNDSGRRPAGQAPRRSSS